MVKSPADIFQETFHQIPFTGIVVSYNEALHLHDCLKSLSFCDELIVVDLGSTDNSIQIAKQCGAEVFHHKWVPVVEQIRKDILEYSKSDWIIHLDPDEIFPVSLERKLCSLISEKPKLGMINIPCQYFFKNNPLNSSIWGMRQFRKAVFHKKKVCFSEDVHSPIQLIDGYEIVYLNRKSIYFIKHLWIDSYIQLFKKHWRYIKKEGEARYNRNERFSVSHCLRETLGALKFSLIPCRGLKGGFLGIFLSFFYSFYISLSLLSLLFYQNKIRGRRC